MCPDQFLEKWEDFPVHDSFHRDLARNLAPHIRVQTGPGAGLFPAILLKGVRIAAEFWGVDQAGAMARLLEAGVWPLRFARNRGVFSPCEQAKLLRSHAAVIGCGGLGGQMVLLLARVGVGALTLCDYDVFDESNLNRQFLCREDNLGKNKAAVAMTTVADVASHIQVRLFEEKAVPENLFGILAGADVAVDCLDSLPTRHHLEHAAHSLGIPFVYGAIAGEEGFCMACRPGGTGLRTVYGGDGPPDEKGAEAALGVPTITPAALACFEAALVVQVLLGKDDPDPVLWHMDLSAFLVEAIGLCPS